MIVDLHTHVLPGVDDGPRTTEEALAVIAAAAADGIGVLAATPHVRRDYPTSPERMEARLVKLRAQLDGGASTPKLLPGGEISLEFAAQMADDELRRFASALARSPERWRHLVRHAQDARVYEQIWDDEDVNA